MNSSGLRFDSLKLLAIHPEERKAILQIDRFHKSLEKIYEFYFLPIFSIFLVSK